MTDIRKASDLLQAILKENGITKASWTTSQSETREFTAENEGFTLYRTLYDVHMSLTVIKDGKKGAVSGNDLGEEALRSAVADAIASAEATPADEANDLAPCAGSAVFEHGVYECDQDALFARSKELCNDVSSRFPQVMLVQTIAKHEKGHSLYRNTNGTEFETKEGHYEIIAEFAGNDGQNTAGLDYCGVLTDDLSAPIIERGSILNHLKSAEAQLHLTDVSGKRTGTVIFTPDCTATMMRFVCNSFLSGSVVLDGTGIWNDKIGQKVADERITLSANVSDPRLVSAADYTGEGFRTVDLPLIEKGILKNQMISLYVANKTGRQPSRCDGSAMVMENGSATLQELLSGVEYGLLVGGFSGGTPGSNGELSGVAKNAFLIENGELKGAVSETMISTNLADMLNQVRGVSSEICTDGWTVFPYLAVDGITISGK